MIGRRTVLAAMVLVPASGAGVARGLSSTARPEALIRALVGDRPLRFEGVTIDMPQLAETGNSVPIAVTVESPMSAHDHVERLHVIAPGNPEPLAVTFQLSPANGVARVSTRLRLARTQTVLVLAEHSDGRVSAAELPVLVTLGACIDELWID
jgi:sulfur-oxidizing protein SoxY